MKIHNINFCVSISYVQFISSCLLYLCFYDQDSLLNNFEYRHFMLFWLINHVPAFLFRMESHAHEEFFWWNWIRDGMFVSLFLCFIYTLVIVCGYFHLFFSNKTITHLITHTFSRYYGYTTNNE
jgi:hypothetical protein